MFACRHALRQAEQVLVADGLAFANSIQSDQSPSASSSSAVQALVEDVEIRKGVTIHTVTFYDKAHFPQGPKSDPSHIPVVVTPGYGSGPGSYARFAAALVRQNPTLTVSCIDWIGWGLSSFPPDLVIDRTNVQATCKQFTDALEQWRIARGAQKLSIVGHSTGGYLSALYAMEHGNNKVHALALSSSIGLPRKPVDFKPFKPNTVLGKALYYGGGFFMEHCAATPMSFLRCAGPFGKRLAKAFVETRFSMPGFSLPKEAFVEYAYHFNAQPSCGEGVVLAVLDTSVYAREPLVDRFEKEEVRAGLPRTHFIHGESDWVSAETGQMLCGCYPEKYSCHVLEKAGHQLFIENPIGMAALVDRLLHE